MKAARVPSISWCDLGKFNIEIQGREQQYLAESTSAIAPIEPYVDAPFLASTALTLSEDGFLSTS